MPHLEVKTPLNSVLTLAFRKVIIYTEMIYYLVCPNFWTWYKWNHTTYNLFLFNIVLLLGWVIYSFSKLQKEFPCTGMGSGWLSPGSTHFDGMVPMMYLRWFIMFSHHLSATVSHCMKHTMVMFSTTDVFFQGLWGGPHKVLSTLVDICWVVGYVYFQLY